MKRAALHMRISTNGHDQMTPLLTVHQTILHNHQTAIENIEGPSLLLFVHLNEFSWTPDAKDGGEEQR